MLRAGRSQRSDICWHRRARAVGRQSAVPSADGLCGRDDDDRPLRAGARPQGAVGAAPVARTTRQRQDAIAYRPAAAHLSARAARGERLLQPGQEGAAVRLFPRRDSDAATDLPGGTVFTCLSHDIVAHETTACAARRPAPPLQGTDQSRRARVPRGVRRHRRAVPAFHHPGGAAPDPAYARRPRAGKSARTARRAVRICERHARCIAQCDRCDRPNTGQWSKAKPDP